MPNFQTHWVVAWEALKGLELPAAPGREIWQAAGRTFSKELRDAVRAVKTADDAAALPVTFKALRRRWQAKLGGANEHAVTCFSAFMLGAVGPDFWMCPADNGHWWDAATARAANYFNMGHYNRSHEQFRRSLAAVAGATSSSAQRELEQSYFCGMATHLAADLFIHQFVNTTAGAYNELQESFWKNEHGNAPTRLWNMHNKVEQYLDSYVRYRFLGDLAQVEPVFGQRELDWFTGNEKGGFEPVGLPLVETLLAIVDRITDVDEDVLDDVYDVLRDQGTRTLVERPLIFPAVFCDRVLGAGMGAPYPFIWRRVVSPEFGAYPKTEVHEDLLGDARSTQTESPRGGHSEEKRLRFFSGAMNDSVPLGKAWNYLAYYVGPNLERIRQKSDKELVNGLDRFYDLSAMQHYGERAVDLARAFAAELQSGYAAGERGTLPTLGRFWNLDTGLGLEVQGIPADTTREVITRLDFVHVLDERIRRGSSLPYYRSGDPAKIRHLTGKDANAEDHSEVEARAFPVVSPPRRFATINEVAESDTRTFLDRIRVGPEACAAPRLLAESLDEFFAETPKPAVRAHDLETKSFLERSELVLQDIKHRLTLELRIAVPDFGQTSDEPAMFFYCDEALGVDDAARKSTHKWIHGKAGLVDFAAGPRVAGPLRQFTARILTNLEIGKDEPRLVEPGKWNDVVPWKANKRFYGRNFALGTGRRFVVRGRGQGESLFVDPPLFAKTTTDFNLLYFDKPFPTEHMFLTIYPLVRAPAGQVYDAFSKEPVTRERFDEEIRKIVGVGWVKIVLLYVLSPSGAAQLDRCFVDGLETPVSHADG